jgi:E3 ubiquitin-protein ligase MARCH6
LYIKDCLEQWLNHSKKDTCELCSSKYEFSPNYAEDTPSTMPLFLVIKTLFNLLIFSTFPIVFRVVFAIFLWLIFAPYMTGIMYRLWLRNNASLIILMSDRLFSIDNIKSDIVEGLLLVLVIAFSFLSLVYILLYHLYIYMFYLLKF